MALAASRFALLSTLVLALAHASPGIDSARSCDAAGQCNNLQDESLPFHAQFPHLQDDETPLSSFPYVVQDDASLLQVMANVSHHISSKKTNSSKQLRSAAKFDLFKTRGQEPASLTVKVTCGGVDKVHKLSNPFRNGGSGVPYHSETEPKVLVKFPRNEATEKEMKEEVVLHNTFPSFVPETKLCSGVIEKNGDTALDSDEQETEKYSVLVKDVVDGFSVEKILMTLCDKNAGANPGNSNKPPKCRMGGRDSKYNAAVYNKVKAMIDKRWFVARRSDLHATFVADAQCIVGNLVKKCVEDGTVTTDLKAENFVYGKLYGTDTYKLWLVDAMVDTKKVYCRVTRSEEGLLKDATEEVRKEKCGDRIMKDGSQERIVSISSWFSLCDQSTCKYDATIPRHNGESDPYVEWAANRPEGKCPADE